MMVWGISSGWLALTVASYCPCRSPQCAEKNKQNLGLQANGKRGTHIDFVSNGHKIFAYLQGFMAVSTDKYSILVITNDVSISHLRQFAILYLSLLWWGHRQSHDILNILQVFNGEFQEMDSYIIYRTVASYMHFIIEVFLGTHPKIGPVNAPIYSLITVCITRCSKLKWEESRAQPSLSVSWNVW